MGSSTPFHNQAIQPGHLLHRTQPGIEYISYFEHLYWRKHTGPSLLIKQKVCRFVSNLASNARQTKQKLTLYTRERCGERETWHWSMWHNAMSAKKRKGKGWVSSLGESISPSRESMLLWLRTTSTYRYDTLSATTKLHNFHLNLCACSTSNCTCMYFKFSSRPLKFRFNIPSSLYLSPSLPSSL